MLCNKNGLLSIIFSGLILVPSICEASGRCVILLHGLLRSHYSMSKLARYLERHDYIVVNKDYPSSRKSIVEIANKEIPLMVNTCLEHHPDNIYFVTHSMGGVVLRQYLHDHPMSKHTRIVMLAPPNHGSRWADLLHHELLFRMITGPAGQELTTEQTSIPNRLDFSLPYQVGIIAGSFNFLPFAQLFFQEPSDGKVTVASTQLIKMNDFIVLPVSHTFIMTNSLVEEQILHFFEHAKFNHKGKG